MQGSTVDFFERKSLGHKEVTSTKGKRQWRGSTGERNGPYTVFAVRETVTPNCALNDTQDVQV